MEDAPRGPSWAAEVANLVPVDAWRDGAPWDWRAVTVDGIRVRADEVGDHAWAYAGVPGRLGPALENGPNPDALRRAVDRVRAEVARDQATHDPRLVPVTVWAWEPRADENVFIAQEHDGGWAVYASGGRLARGFPDFATAVKGCRRQFDWDALRAEEIEETANAKVARG